MKEKKKRDAVFPLTLDVVENLAEILKRNGLHELSLTDDEASITLRLQSQDAPSQVVLASSAANLPSTSPQIAQEAPKEKPKEIEETRGHVIKSPMVGTVYLSPRPGAPQFVRAGEQVKKGQTILIIEAMKVMNQISAPRDGVIADILVSDKEPVEFDQELVVYRA